MEINYCMHCMERLPLGQSRCSACGNDNGNIPVRHNALNPGTILRGRYLVGRVLGQGGFGITYIGMDLLLEIKVCIKEYYPSGLASRNSSVSNEIRWEQGGEDSRRTGSSSFLQEARKMAQLSNIPSVARVQDMFLENNTSYIAMEFIEGRTLKAQLQKEGLMDFNSCVSMLRPMLEDLVKIHSSGLIHRDISPDNIMVRPDGRVCLLDLGTVKDLNVQNSPASAVVAKTGFSPLEQYSSGKGVGPWTDVYAMCATIAYCVTGRCLPSALDRMEEDTMTLEGGRYPMNQGQKDALIQGLQLRAKNRLQNMQQLIDRLDGAAPAPEPVLEAIPCTEPIPQSGWKTSPVPGPISQEPEKPKEQPKEPEKPKEQPKPKVDEVPSTDIADQTKASSGGIIYT